MSYQRTVYDQPDTAREMRADCAACALSLRPHRSAIDAESLTVTTPELLREAFVERTAKPQIEVSEAVAHLASRLHLHLD